MEKHQRKSIFDYLKNYCVFAKEDDYIEVTEWTNGEGFDVDIDGKQYIHLTYGQLEAINYLVKSLDYNKE